MVNYCLNYQGGGDRKANNRKGTSMSELGKSIFAFICVTVLGIGITGAEVDITAAHHEAPDAPASSPPDISSIITADIAPGIDAPGLPYDEPVAEVFDIVTTTTTPPIPGFADARCPEIWDLAVEVGWPAEWLPRFDRIVMAESGCRPDAISRTKDYGYAQINWAAHGNRLNSKGISKDMLLDPRVNLTEALWIAEYAAEHYGCWSQPWYMSGDWC